LELVDTAHQGWLDAEWRFRMRVPTSFRPQPGSIRRPDTLQRLVRYTSADGRARIDVHGERLQHDVDVVDWLACSRALPQTLIPEAKERDIAHVALEWEARGERRWGRWVCRKSGSRMFLLCAETTLDASMAGELSDCTSSFEPEIEPLQRYAEPLRCWGGEQPLRWNTHLPQSWIVELGSASDTAASLQAEHVRPGTYFDPEQPCGKLAFALLTRSTAETAQAIAELYLDAIRDHGLVLEPGKVGAHVVQRPFIHGWQLVAPVRRDEHRGEVRCQVMCDERVWALGGVLSLRRQDDAAAWMQNKRALDLAMHFLRLEP
jgi:hypothetical protein